MVENRVISKLLQEGSIRRAVERGITEEHFVERLGEYRFITEHFREYGRVPEVSTLLERFPDFQHVRELPEPVDYYLDALRRKREFGILSDSLIQASEVVSADPAQARTMLEGTIARIYADIAEVTDSLWSDGTSERLDDYERRARFHAAGEVPGIPTPWDGMNALTMGLQDEHLVTVTGRPKRGKSWVMCLLAHHAISVGRRALFVSMEMSHGEILRRMDAIRFRLPYDALRHGSLGEEAAGRYASGLASLDDSAARLVVTSSTEWGARAGVTFVEAKIRQHGPDIVLIDGVYLMHDDRDGKTKTERLYNLTQDLKRVAKQAALPVVVSTQQGRTHARRERVGGLQGVQWSDSLVGDTLIQTSDGLTEIRRLEGRTFHVEAFGKTKLARGFKSGMKRVCAIRAGGVDIFRCSKDHRVLVCSGDKVLWKTAGSISTDDYLVYSSKPFNAGGDTLPVVEISTGNGRRKPVSIPDKMNPDLAWLIGAMIGDGSVNAKNGQTSLHVGYDTGYAEEARRIMRGCFGDRGKIRLMKTRFSRREQVSVYWYGRNLACWWRGIMYVDGDKSLRPELLGLNGVLRRNLLAGLIDSDRHFDAGRFAVSYKTSNLALATMVAKLSMSCGVYATVYRGSTWYDVRLSGVDLHSVHIPCRVKKLEHGEAKNAFSVPRMLAKRVALGYCRRTGFRYRSRKLTGSDKSLAFLIRKAVSGRGFGDGTLSLLDPAYTGMRFIKVDSVKMEGGMEDMWDVEVLSSCDKRIIGNGHVTHNSFGQDSDMVWELFQTRAMRTQRRMQVVILAQREGDVGDIHIQWDLEAMDFSETDGTFNTGGDYSEQVFSGGTDISD